MTTTPRDQRSEIAKFADNAWDSISHPVHDPIGATIIGSLLLTLCFLGYLVIDLLIALAGLLT